MAGHEEKKEHVEVHMHEDEDGHGANKDFVRSVGLSTQGGSAQGRVIALHVAQLCYVLC